MKKVKKMSIERRIERSGLFDFSDGYLENGYFMDGNKVDSLNKVNNIKSEDDLEYIILDDLSDDTFDKWFSDGDEFEIIDDAINCESGFCKFIVNKEERYVKLMVVPYLFVRRDSNIKIFGFDLNTGELVREINEEKLNEMLKEPDLFII
jgi:hypothetical protein